MSKLLVFYSLGGKTKAVCEALAPLIGADVAEIREARKRSLFGAFVAGAPVAMGGGVSKIQPVALDPAGYDEVIVASPIWAGNVVPAVNAFLREAGARRALFGKTVFAVVCGSSAARNMEDKLADEVRAHGARYGGHVLVDVATVGSKPFRAMPEDAAGYARLAGEAAGKLGHLESKARK